MRKLRNNRLSVKEKLKTIQAFLNGELDDIAPPRTYQVFSMNSEEYTVTPVVPFHGPSIQMNHEEYEEWSKKLRPEDVVNVIVFQEMRTDPRDKPIEEETPTLSNPIEHRTEPTPAPQPEARKEAKNRLKSEPIKEVEETVLVSVPKRSGKLSEYGDTWDAKHTDIFYS